MLTVSFRAVVQSFGGRRIFGPLSAEVRSGSTTAVAGRNGSGKSTLLRLAAHLLLPTAGEVAVEEDGVPLVREKLRNRLALVSPELRFYPGLTAEENLSFLLGLRGIRLTYDGYLALLSRVGLSEREVGGVYAGAFSTGMRQRLKLAALFASGSDIWLLDEPGANLDEAGRTLVLHEARQAAVEGKVVLWATNDAREEAAADAVIHVDGGQAHPA